MAGQYNRRMGIGVLGIGGHGLGRGGDAAVSPQTDAGGTSRIGLRYACGGTTGKIAAQKERYGEIVRQKMATNTARNLAVKRMVGISRPGTALSRYAPRTVSGLPRNS